MTADKACGYAMAITLNGFILAVLYAIVQGVRRLLT